MDARPRARFAASIPLFLGLFCIWDSDTLGDELRGLPDAHDLVIGRWFQHGPAYYEERLVRLGGRADLSLSDLDDIAVAHERLGDHERAIEVIEEKGRRPEIQEDQEHLYRYHANLGTFFAHAGEFPRAIEALERAVALNPAAHFGRERYQIDLVRYVQAAKEDATLWEQENFLSHSGRLLRSLHGPSFRDGSVESMQERGLAAEEVEWEEAYTAVAGMIRFGGQDGAELYRSLGDLFLYRQLLHLAWWSWQRALEGGHPADASIRAAIAGVEDHWRRASANNGLQGRMLPPDQAIYAEQRANADAWLAAFQAAEARALEEGRDPSTDEALTALLRQAENVVPRIKLPIEIAWYQSRLAQVVALIALLFVLIKILVLRSTRSERRLQ